MQCDAVEPKTNVKWHGRLQDAVNAHPDEL